MLLTGFDAPIEQVMYIDKRIREHKLLQAIARVNRVARGTRTRLYGGLHRLGQSPDRSTGLYAATDEQEELREGLKSITSELPVLEERYQRLVQLFRAAGVGEIEEFVLGRLAQCPRTQAVVHTAVTALKDEKQRADFEVYLKKFLTSLDIILPHKSAHTFRVPARRFGYILRDDEGALQGQQSGHWATRARK